jgi:type IV secretion system protein VirD4
MTQDFDNQIGNRDFDEKGGKTKTKRLAVILAITLVGMWGGTQYVAGKFQYHDALGFNIGRVYPPYSIATWYLSWNAPEYGDIFETGMIIAAMICAAGFMAFLIAMNIMKNTATPNKYLHGSARWAEEQDIINATLLPHPGKKGKDGKPPAPEGVYVGGWVNKKTGQFHYLRHNGPEHVLCYAPTRSGKGVGLVNPTLLSWKESCIVTDIKGELWELTSGWRKHYAKNRVIRFEPAALNSAAWNVFDSIRFGTEYEERDVGNVASLIVDPDGKGLEDHWSKTAYALIVGCILHVHYKAKQDKKCERSLSGVDAMLSNPDHPIGQTWEEMKNTPHLPPLYDKSGTMIAPERTHPTVAKAAQDMIDRAEAEAASVLSTTKSYLSLYRDPVIRNNTNKSDFTIQQIANCQEPVSLYIITKPADLNRIRPIFRLIITMVVSILADELKTVNGRMERANIHRTLLMLDEFPSLGKLDIMQRALAFIAGYGLKAYLITQDLSQLYAAYGKEESITSNCHVQIAYPPNRPETAKYISGLTGGTTVLKDDITVSGKRTGLFQNNVSVTKREQARNLLTEDEVLRMPSPLKDHNGNITKPGHMLIFVSGSPAIHGQQILYFKDKAFLKRSQVPAPPETDSLKDCMSEEQREEAGPETTTIMYSVSDTTEIPESFPEEIRAVFAEMRALDKAYRESLQEPEAAEQAAGADSEPEPDGQAAEPDADDGWSAVPEQENAGGEGATPTPEEMGELEWKEEAAPEEPPSAEPAGAKKGDPLDGLDFV